MSVSWSYFDRFEAIVNEYMPRIGEGETMASQIVTAVNKLVYKWYNDGDVFDNTQMSGWCNDLSSYANWLDQYTKEAPTILDEYYKVKTESDYEKLLKRLADSLLEEECLSQYENMKASGSIYNCKGRFVFEEDYDEDDDYNEWESYDDEDEEEFDWDY